MRASSPLLALLAVGLIVALGLGLDRVMPVLAAPEDEPVLAGEATSGSWYCAAGDAGGRSELRIVAAAPPSEATAPAELATWAVADGEQGRIRHGQVFPSAAVVERFEAPPDELGIAARWWDQPVAVTRLWTVTTDAGVSGRVVGPCAAEPSERWVIPGVATAGGAEAVLHLVNPFDSDATVAVTFTTPGGVLEPRLLENVVVPRRSVLEISLNRHAPERADLGVVVDTRAGRVVAEAVQSFNAAIGGVEGLSLVAAAPETAETWTIPWFADSAERASWLWLTNAGDDAAAVELIVHTDGGGIVPEGLEELMVEPGTVQRVDLRGLLPEGAEQGAVSVRSANGEPLAASIATQFVAEEPERTGIAVQLGAPVPDGQWVLSGGPTAGRTVVLHLVNPGADDAVVDLALWAGAGVVRPDALQGLRVPAGAAVDVPLSGSLPPAADDHTVFVTAREGTVVAARSATSDSEQLDPVVTLGTPLGSLAGGATVPPIRYVPGMTQRIGTELGPHAEEEGLLPAPTEDPDDLLPELPPEG